MKTYRWILTVVLMLTLSLPATPVSASGGSASITLTLPTPNPGLIGDDVNFALVIDVAYIDPGVAGVEIYLAYDPALVAPSTSPTGVVEALPDFFGPSNITINEILLDDPKCLGQSPCIRLVAAGPPQTTHSGAVARFHFQGKAEGTACFRVLASTMKNADGYPVDHSPASPICVKIIRRYNVKGKVIRQGTPAELPNLGGGTLACSVVWSTSGATQYGPVFTDDKGDFKLTNLPGGAHTLHAEYPGYLTSEKSLAFSGDPTTIDAGTTTLRGGDVNSDNKINILDIGKIISLFGRTGFPVRSDPAEGCVDPDEPTDINDDGNINISDLAIAAGNWGRIGPTNWP